MYVPNKIKSIQTANYLTVTEKLFTFKTFLYKCTTKT